MFVCVYIGCVSLRHISSFLVVDAYWFAMHDGLWGRAQQQLSALRLKYDMFICLKANQL